MTCARGKCCEHSAPRNKCDLELEFLAASYVSTDYWGGYDL